MADVELDETEDRSRLPAEEGPGLTPAADRSVPQPLTASNAEAQQSLKSGADPWASGATSLDQTLGMTEMRSQLGMDAQRDATQREGAPVDGDLAATASLFGLTSAPVDKGERNRTVDPNLVAMLTQPDADRDKDGRPEVAPQAEAKDPAAVAPATQPEPKKEEGGFWSRVGSNISSAWNATTGAATDAANYVADSRVGRAVTAGAQWTGNKVDQGLNWAGDKVNQGIDYAANTEVGKTAIAAGNWTIDKAEKGLQMAGDGVKAGLDWAGDTKVGQLAKSAYNTVDGLANGATDLLKTGIGKLNSGIDSYQSTVGAIGDWAKAKTAGIPVLGTATDALAGMAKFQADVGGGFVKGAGSLVEGLGTAVLNPLDTVGGLYSMAEHVPTGLMPNPLKMAHDLVNVANRDKGLKDALGDNFDVTKNAADNGSYWSKVGESLWAPFKKSIDEGKPGEAIGRGLFDVATLVAGGIGIGSKTAKGAEIANVVDDAARVGSKVAPVEDIARIGGKVDDVAAAGTKVDEVATAAKLGRPGSLENPLSTDGLVGPSHLPGKFDKTGKLVEPGADSFRLNRKAIENGYKIEGQPEAVVQADAAREALAAQRAAAKGNVDRVVMGQEADKLINGTVGQQMSADVVGVTKQGKYILSEAKGTDVVHGLEQLKHSGTKLGAERVDQFNLVMGSEIKTPGFTVSKGGQLELHGEPYLVHGKPVNVTFTK